MEVIAFPENFNSQYGITQIYDCLEKHSTTHLYTFLTCYHLIVSMETEKLNAILPSIIGKAITCGEGIPPEKLHIAPLFFKLLHQSRATIFLTQDITSCSQTLVYCARHFQVLTSLL
ncbi:hypothetical protein NL108_009485 [Boleophthalmus pectinirostris]|nr:hypothetical protein NL108_009485 [Boleophthalmus pectinirostris]